jgi:predicted metal-dependent HD superfamily phosphohydrolase
MENDYLQSIWQKALSSYPKAAHFSERFFAQLSDAYGHKDRYYHNAQHIGKMLGLLEQYQAKLKSVHLYYLAAFYHDIIYNALRTDNEQKSAEWAAADFQAMGIKKGDSEFVQKLILLTSGHAESDKILSHEEALFLDSDIQILGSEFYVYQEYSKNIRKEYQRIPELIYYQKRMAFLKKMQAQKRLFNSPEFKKSYEKQARENLDWEINDIKTKL